MEGDWNLMSGAGGVDMQGSVRFDYYQHQPTPAHYLNQPMIQRSNRRHGPEHHQSRNKATVFPPQTVASRRDTVQYISFGDSGSRDEENMLIGYEDVSSLVVTSGSCYNDKNKGNKGSNWHRVKWSDEMVKLLISAVSYISEGAASEIGGDQATRKFAMLQKKGKWKFISEAMAERGFSVSPQQCEDKFNDLNKRYKRLNDILGKEMSCQVVENHALLDSLNHLSQKAREEVKKLLSSKHLFYEEMYSYHSSNRLHLPHDPALKHSIQLAIRNCNDGEINYSSRPSTDDYGDDYSHPRIIIDPDEVMDGLSLNQDSSEIGGIGEAPAMWMKNVEDPDDFSFEDSFDFYNLDKASQLNSQTYPTDSNCVFPEGSTAAWFHDQWMKTRLLQLEEKKIEIQMEIANLEQQFYEWQKLSKKRGRSLEKLRLRNERMKFENRVMALELKQRGNIFDS